MNKSFTRRSTMRKVSIGILLVIASLSLGMASDLATAKQADAYCLSAGNMSTLYYSVAGVTLGAESPQQATCDGNKIYHTKAYDYALNGCPRVELKGATGSWAAVAIGCDGFSGLATASASSYPGSSTSWQVRVCSVNNNTCSSPQSIKAA